MAETLAGLRGVGAHDSGLHRRAAVHPRPAARRRAGAARAHDWTSTRRSRTRRVPPDRAVGPAGGRRGAATRTSWTTTRHRRGPLRRPGRGGRGVVRRGRCPTSPAWRPPADLGCAASAEQPREPRCSSWRSASRTPAAAPGRPEPSPAPGRSRARAARHSVPAFSTPSATIRRPSAWVRSDRGAHDRGRALAR